MKELLSFLIMPFTFSVLIILAGLLLRYYGKKKKGMVLLAGGMVLLLFFSSRPGSWLMLSPLESQYQPLLDTEKVTTRNIVVLSGGHHTNSSLPATSQINSSTLHRLMEGVRIQQQLPGSRLILKGGSGHDVVSTSQIMYKLIRDSGIDSTNIELYQHAYNTEQEARAVSRILDGEDELILVTSARHMPRSMLLFQAQGLNPIAAPTHHRFRGPPKSFLDYLKWSPEYLNYSHLAMHEYAGIVWSWMRGKL